jgi:DNA polymerase-3 subunit alpha
LEKHNFTADVEATTRCFLELIRREIIPRATGCASWLFSEISGKIQEIQLIGLKHINLKKLLMPFVSNLKKQTATVSKQNYQNKKVLVDTILCIYITTLNSLFYNLQ